MTKTLKLTELDCANCAAHVEKGLNKLDGVISATVSFMTKKIILELPDDADFDALLPAIEKVVKRVEPDCNIVL